MRFAHVKSGVVRFCSFCNHLERGCGPGAGWKGGRTWPDQAGSRWPQRCRCRSSLVVQGTRSSPGWPCTWPPSHLVLNNCETTSLSIPEVEGSQNLPLILVERSVIYLYLHITYATFLVYCWTLSYKMLCEYRSFLFGSGSSRFLTMFQKWQVVKCQQRTHF